MMPRSQACDPRRLEQLLRGHLSAEYEREIEAHLSVCPACRAKLDESVGGKRWWSEVWRNLGGDGATSAFLDLDSDVARGPGRAPLGVDLSFLAPSEHSEALGRLGGYEVLEVIGRGGMGVVLKAFDPALHRPVAIKILLTEYAASGTARKRFAREAQAAAAVVHDHVVSVHAVDASHAPPYLVMSFIAGRSLQQRIDRDGPLELREILRIGMQTAAGLAAAHAQGLVHRDIKPANIMLENGVERVRITDFGLARAVDDASITQSGFFAGTPQYMAPEQARGEAVDTRADLFALGSVLYAMSVGRPPFRADSGLAVMRMVADVEAPPIRAENPDVPLWLEGIVRKLHAKDPAARFQSAAEVAELLERCLAHVQQPDRNPLPPAAAELGRQAGEIESPRRAKWPLRVAVVVVAATVVATVVHFGILQPRNLDESARTASKSAASIAANSEIAVASTVANLKPTLEELTRIVKPWDPELFEESRVLRGRIDGAGGLFAAEPPPPAPDSRFLRQHLLSLVARFTGAGDDPPAMDPFAEQVESLRRRIGRLEREFDPPRP